MGVGVPALLERFLRNTIFVRLPITEFINGSDYPQVHISNAPSKVPPTFPYFFCLFLSKPFSPHMIASIFF